MCPWARSFFGLPGKDYIYEEVYYLTRECGLTYTEVWDMPVEVRHWWIKKDQKEKEEKAKRGQPSGHVDPFGRHHGK